MVSKNVCCVSTCKNTANNSKFKFYSFPKSSIKKQQRAKWIVAVNRKKYKYFFITCVRLIVQFFIFWLVFAAPMERHGSQKMDLTEYAVNILLETSNLMLC